MARRQNYLNNKDMLKQIHISKSNYSWFEDRDKHHQHDIILYSTKEIPDAVEQARQNKAKRLQKLAWDANTDKKKKQVIAHEKKHIADMKSGKLNYDKNFIYWNNEKYKRTSDKKINYKGKLYIEGSPALPWEKAANNAEKQIN